MPFDYDGASAGVFTRIGKIVKYINTRLATATTTLPAELKAIADLYEAADLTALIEGLFAAYGSFQQAVVNERRSLAAYADKALLDRDTVLEPLGITSANMAEVQAALIQQMIADAETIKRCTVTIGPVTAAALNTGNGTVLTTKVLDGFNAPISGGLANLNYNGLSSELAVPSESMRLTCVSDSMRDGTPEGSERFLWEGAPGSQPLDYQEEGSGRGPTLTVANSARIVVDGSFENWGGAGNNTPSNWTIGNGTAGTHIFRESTEIYRGTYSAKLLGTGAAATIGLEQTIAAASLKGRRRYAFGVRIKASAVPAAGQIECHFSGTGYSKTAPTAEVQTVEVSGTPTGGDYTLTYPGPPGSPATTAAIAFDATSATVQAALRLLPGLESVVVATSAGAPPDVTHSITFLNVPGEVAQLTSTSSLTGGTPVIAHATTTPGVEGDCVVIPAAAFPTAWTLAWFWISMPTIIPSDWKLVLQVTGTLSNTVAVYLDSLAFEPAVYHGGIAASIQAGSTRFIAGDRFTFPVTNDAAGVFQSFWRRWYKAQLPSVGGGGETISDALAT